MNSQVNTSTTLQDAAGATLSAACMIKCIGLPLASAALPALSTVTLGGHAAHLAILALSTPLAVKRLVIDSIRDSKFGLAAASALGLGVLAYDSFPHIHALLQEPLAIERTAVDLSAPSNTQNTQRAVNDPICGPAGMTQNNNLQNTGDVNKPHEAEIGGHDHNHDHQHSSSMLNTAFGLSLVGGAHILRLREKRKNYTAQ